MMDDHNITLKLPLTFCQKYLTAYDRRTQQWPMMASPIPVFMVIGAYLLFVTTIGPRIMAKRKPLVLRNTMLTYNSLLVIINVFFFIVSIKWLDFGRLLFVYEFPSDANTSSDEMWHLKLFYVYCLTKIFDLADTVFFVLRKKDKQISKLHLYHHSVVPFLGWLSLSVRCTAPAIVLFVFLNSAVHAIMYTYYALAALGPKVHKYLWWKRYITQIQLLQFLACFIYPILVYPYLTNYPSECFLLGISQPPLFFYMFLDFYFKSYKKKSAPKEIEKQI